MTEQVTTKDEVQSVHSIVWIDRDDRVPNNRRQVLVFGDRIRYRFGPLKSGFLGVSRYNMDRDGGRFDIEKPGRWCDLFVHVTHWAEITDPEGGLL